MIQSHFFIELGKILYAIAKSDGEISQAEEKKFENIIESIKLQKHSSDSYFADDKEILLTKLSFYNCIKNKVKVKEAVKSYLQFRNLNDDKLDTYHKTLATKLITEIALAYKGISESEKQIIAELMKITSEK